MNYEKEKDARMNGKKRKRSRKRRSGEKAKRRVGYAIKDNGGGHKRDRKKLAVKRELMHLFTLRCSRRPIKSEKHSRQI